MMSVKVYKHQVTGRYLAGVMRSKEIETVKLLEDAKTWELQDNNRKSNFRSFHKRNGAMLEALGFKVVEELK